MTRRQKIFIIIIIILLFILIAAIAVYLYMNYRSQQQPVTEPEQEVTEEQPAETAVEKPAGIYLDGSAFAEVPVETTEPVSSDNSSIKAIALSFVERFGSFSNQSDFDNIEELQIFMSPSMKQWANTYVAENRAKGVDSSEYYGVTTKVLSTEIQELDDEKGTAKLLLNTQRVEYRGAQRESSVSYREIDVTMVRDNNIWYVDSAYWK